MVAVRVAVLSTVPEGSATTTLALFRSDSIALLDYNIVILFGGVSVVISVNMSRGQSSSIEIRPFTVNSCDRLDAIQTTQPVSRYGEYRSARSVGIARVCLVCLRKPESEIQSERERERESARPKCPKRLEYDLFGCIHTT